MSGVEVHVLRGNCKVQARNNKDTALLKGGEQRSFAIHKDRPVICRVSKGGRATAQSTTGVVLLFEFEDEDGYVHEEKLKPPFRMAMTGGKWVVMAPSVA